MLGKLSEQISNIDKISKYIFKYGLFACLIVFIITSYSMNKAQTIREVLVAREIAGVGFNMLVEVVVGGVLFDICMKNHTWYQL